ncbi:MAG: PDZ domain-containing protein [marine benthic group bacterium]|nr:PDZ domain-containing protein [Gemmatimonadota bacterium]
MRARRLLLSAVTLSGVALLSVPVSPSGEAAGSHLVAQEHRVPARAPVVGVTVSPDAPGRARIGVFLDPFCAPADSTAECDRSPVVVSVVEGGPADRAGVRARDTIVALNGVPLSTSDGRKSLQSLAAGEPVRLSLAGPQGRRELEVMPEVRAPSRTMRFEWRSPAPDGGVERVQVFRFPAPEFTEELEIRLDSLEVGEAGRAFVLIEPDAEGRLNVEIADQDSLLVRSRVPAPDGEPRAAWVVQGKGLARRLEAVRDRTLEVARVQLDSLARMHRGAVWTFTPDGGQGRIAGAELREMTPELAEYFDGQSDGLLVLRVIPDTPAGRLGLRGGDVVVEVNGHSVPSSADFRREVHEGQDTGIVVKWVRKGILQEGLLKIR